MRIKKHYIDKSDAVYGLAIGIATILLEIVGILFLSVSAKNCPEPHEKSDNPDMNALAS